MLTRLISGDAPRSRVLAAVLLVILAGLAFAPFLFPGVRSVSTAAQICVFIALVASYDLMLGYAGIVSFAHTMFFGMGAYGVALACEHMERGFAPLLVGAGAGAIAAAILAFGIGLFSLRVRAIFFAMITLAVASAVAVLVSQLSQLTGGEDGVTFRTPRELSPAFKLADFRILGVRLDGKLLAYYLVFFGALAIFLVLLRIVNSPFGRVLQAIRENDFRAEAIGYRVVHYRTAATCISAAAAALSGSLFAVWLRYVGPDTVLSFEIMIDILIMVVIGGMGTLYGAVIGATLLLLAQNYLQELMGGASDALSALPLLPDLLNPDRWLLWLGVLFVASVYFFPSGIVGRLRGHD
ncbi:MAG: branched-chain amino acid ABC transporter permease [Pseudomonadota bacterium]